MPIVYGTRQGTHPEPTDSGKVWPANNMGSVEKRMKPEAAHVNNDKPEEGPQKPGCGFEKKSWPR